MPWRTYYEVNADTIFAIGDPVNETVVTSTVRTCLLTATDLFVAHVSGTPGPAVTKEIKMTDITLRMPVYTNRLPERVIGNNGYGIQEVRRSLVVKVE